jgi:hypothetical protein
MKSAITAILLAAALSVTADPAHTYSSGFSVALDRGDDLSSALPDKFGSQLASQPIALQPQDLPQITPIISHDETKTLRQVSISAGLIDLVNHLSHAKAIDHIQPGFYDQYVQNIARAAEANENSIQLPAMVDERYWKDDVMNDQASYFNQMIGLIISINLSHHYLGHFDKYAAKMAGIGNATTPINEFLTPSEWEVSIRAGATDALNCALSTDGGKSLFNAIDAMPRRPAWTLAILPRDVDIKKLDKELSKYEDQFYHGGLKFGSLDKFQFLPAWNQSTLECLAQKAFNGSPALLAIVQRPMIDIHSDELVRQFDTHVPGVLQSVGNSLPPVIQTELNAVGQNPGDN